MCSWIEQPPDPFFFLSCFHNFFWLKLKRCQQFWFSGCRGNRNRFDTKQECEDLCLKRAW
uniref:BPTI/Kunitz inhibitor domain-containing protein n=1 Tax=Callorhinchus milii TaxID=7868 RepID=A0A4W3GBI5_CALMI